MKQNGNSVQWYKQRFELLAYETNFPHSVWGEEFYKGLSAPIKDKLAQVSFLNRQDYNLVAYHAVEFDVQHQMRQEERAVEKKSYDNIIRAPKHYTHPNVATLVSELSNDTPATGTKSKLSQEDRNYRIAHNLCMYDGGDHPTHLCKKLIEKCKKEGKPLPNYPNSQPQMSQ